MSVIDRMSTIITGNYEIKSNQSTMFSKIFSINTLFTEMKNFQYDVKDQKDKIITEFRASDENPSGPFNKLGSYKEVTLPIERTEGHFNCPLEELTKSYPGQTDPKASDSTKAKANFVNLSNNILSRGIARDLEIQAKNAVLDGKFYSLKDPSKFYQVNRDANLSISVSSGNRWTVSSINPLEQVGNLASDYYNITGLMPEIAVIGWDAYNTGFLPNSIVKSFDQSIYMQSYDLNMLNLLKEPEYAWLTDTLYVGTVKFGGYVLKVFVHNKKIRDKDGVETYAFPSKDVMITVAKPDTTRFIRTTPSFILSKADVNSVNEMLGGSALFGKSIDIPDDVLNEKNNLSQVIPKGAVNCFVSIGDNGRGFSGYYEMYCGLKLPDINQFAFLKGVVA